MWPARSGFEIAADATAATTADIDGDGRLDVVVAVNGGAVRSYVVQAGGGYLSQSAPTLAFGRAGAKVAAIEVRWPDGTSTRVQGGRADGHYSVSQPAK